MSAFSLLWKSILRSSLWVKESKETRLLWVAMLADRDSEGIVRTSLVGLADMAKITPDECREALNVLLSPDPDDTSKVEEGRRLRVVPGGWQIVNHDMYRFSTEAKREFWRNQKAEQRAKEKMTPEERAIYDKAKKQEYARRKKQVAKDGALQGAREAMGEGLAEAHDQAQEYHKARTNGKRRKAEPNGEHVPGD